jgi:hypothetical protein
MSDDSKRGGSFTFPLIALLLIFFGVILLLNNFGYLPWDIWGTIWRLWPALLVLIGINLIFGRTRPWIAFWLTFVTLAVVAGVVFWVLGPAATQKGLASFSQPLTAAQKAEVSVEFGAGKLRVEPLSAGSDRLVAGEVAQDAVPGVVNAAENVARVRIASPAAGWLGGPGKFTDWRVQLTRNIPLDLILKTGANECSVDLSGLQVSLLQMETGASRNEITFPAQGETTARITAGAAELKLNIPAGVAARIKMEAGASTIDIDPARFTKAGDTYLTAGYESAPNRLNLEIRGGVSSVIVRNG